MLWRWPDAKKRPDDDHVERRASEPVTNAAPIPQMTKKPDPGAATVFAAQDAAEKAKAMQDTATLQQKPAPQEPMTKGEESKAMPLPAQANDHSNTALDKKNGG